MDFKRCVRDAGGGVTGNWFGQNIFQRNGRELILGLLDITGIRNHVTVFRLHYSGEAGESVLDQRIRAVNRQELFRTFPSGHWPEPTANSAGHYDSVDHIQYGWVSGLNIPGVSIGRKPLNTDLKSIKRSTENKAEGFDMEEDFIHHSDRREMTSVVYCIQSKSPKRPESTNNPVLDGIPFSAWGLEESRCKPEINGTFQVRGM